MLVHGIAGDDDVKRLWISTTIKRKYLDEILSGDKKEETKVYTDFWEKRLSKVCHHLDDGGKAGINLLCGRESVKFDVPEIIEGEAGGPVAIDGVLTLKWYRIQLGNRLFERMNKLCRKCGHTVVTKSTDTCWICGGYLEPIGEPFWG